MKIGIDITPAINQTAGIGRYTRQLVTNLLEIDNRNQYLLYSLFGNLKERTSRRGHPFSEEVSPYQKARNYQLKLYNYRPQLLKSYFLFLKSIGKSPDFLTKEADIIHSTDFVLPASEKRPSVLTIHDVIFLKYPQFYTWRNRNYMKSVANFSIKRANAVITYSNATKNDLIDRLGVNEDKIIVIPLAVDERFMQAKDDQIEEIRRKYKIPQTYILTLSTLEPRKNIRRLFEAFAKLKKDKSIEHKLVIAGQKGWGNKDFFSKLVELGINDDVIITGFIEEEDLPAIYSGASIFVYPSLYEGFGLPPLEAMACGTPVICSNTSSLPEVVGDAAWQVDPTDTEDIAKAMAKIIEDKSLALDLRTKGLKQAKKFDWKTTAEKTLQVYNQLAN